LPVGAGHHHRSLAHGSRLAKQRTDERHGFPHGIRHDVAIGLHREADLRMSEQLHYDTRMYALGEQEAGTRMAQVVEPYAPQSGLADDALEIFIERSRLKRCSAPGRK